MQRGQIFESEFSEEADMLSVKVPNYKSFYTNELIDQINDFDQEKIIADAKGYKI